jgi:hypothetical protein
MLTTADEVQGTHVAARDDRAAVIEMLREVKRVMMQEVLLMPSAERSLTLWPPL